MSEIKYKVEILYGHKELKGFHRMENGQMVYYGYSITYDRDGFETSRTQPEAIGAIWCE